METSDFERVVDSQLNRCASLLYRKGEEYTPCEDMQKDDRLSFFKKAADLTEETPQKALFGMLSKHLISITDMCCSGKYPKDRWLEKITDSMNYLILLRAMLEDEDTADYMLPGGSEDSGLLD